MNEKETIKSIEREIKYREQKVKEAKQELEWWKEQKRKLEEQINAQ